MQKSCLLGMALGLACLAPAQSNFPPPPAPTGNPITAEKTLLGMALFFEEQLSSTGTVACATCHDLSRAGSDPRSFTNRHPGPDRRLDTADDIFGSPGIVRTGRTRTEGHPEFGYSPQVTGRRAPSLLNLAWQTRLFYDGRAGIGQFRDPVTNQVVLSGNVALENLMLQPPLNPVEMGHVGRTWPEVAQKVAASEPLLWASDLPARLAGFVQGRSYPQLFQLAFGTPEVTPARIAMALATYLRTLNSDQSKWDRVLAGSAWMTPLEQQGLHLFENPIAGAVACNACHGDFNASSRTQGPVLGQLQVVGPTVAYYSAPQPTLMLFHNIGVRPVLEDPGRGGLTQVQTEMGQFRIATLRNVELTAPYFHNGAAHTLREVLEFYNRGGDFHANQAPGVQPRGYSNTQIDAIEAALAMLTDPRVAAGVEPFDQPRLGSQNGKLPTTIGEGGAVGQHRATAVAPIAPRLGETAFSILLDGASPSSFTMLMWDTAVLGGWTPGNFGLVLATSANFLVVPIGFAQPAFGRGTARVRLPIPADPGMRGVQLYAQWLVIDPLVVGGIATSNALGILLQ